MADVDSPAAPPAGPRIIHVVAQLFDILEPLEPELRARALRSVAAMLIHDGGALTDVGVAATPASGEPTPHQARGSSTFAHGKKARAWLERNGITDAMLDQVFHIENGDAKPQLFASVPGTTKKAQTVNCYLLIGAQNFLATDELKVTEAEVLGVARAGGYYDRTNHSTYRGTLGNRFSGNKDSGYILTPPGQNAAAELIKAIAADSVKK